MRYVTLNGKGYSSSDQIRECIDNEVRIVEEALYFAMYTQNELVNIL